jgi:hypothetical protein
MTASATAIYAFPPQFVFGSEPGTTLLNFYIPNLRVNVGQYGLRLYLTEPPRGKVYEIVDDVCPFEVVRDNFFNWWGPEICTYHEDFTVEVVGEKLPKQVIDKINTGARAQMAASYDPKEVQQ